MQDTSIFLAVIEVSCVNTSTCDERDYSSGATAYWMQTAFLMVSTSPFRLF